MIRATFESETTEDMERWAIRFLTDLGYVVERNLFPVEKRETPATFARRMGISAPLLCTRLRAPDCPKFASQRGKKRTKWLVANPDLEAFCRNRLNTP